MKKIATFDTITKLVKYLKADCAAPFAKKLLAPRRIALTGDLAGEEAFDGSKDVSIKTTVPFLTAFVRQPGTEYKAGDTVYVKDGGANIRLSCVASGRTSDDELTSEGVTSLHEKRIFPVEKNFEFSHAHAEGGRIVLGDAMGIALEANEGNTKGTWSRIDANGDEMD